MELLPVTERTQRMVRTEGHDSNSRLPVHNPTPVPWAATIGGGLAQSSDSALVAVSQSSTKLFNSKDEIK